MVGQSGRQIRRIVEPTMAIDRLLLMASDSALSGVPGQVVDFRSKSA